MREKGAAGRSLNGVQTPLKPSERRSVSEHDPHVLPIRRSRSGLDLRVLDDLVDDAGGDGVGENAEVPRRLEVLIPFRRTPRGMAPVESEKASASALQARYHETLFNDLIPTSLATWFDSYQ